MALILADRVRETTSTTGTGTLTLTGPFSGFRAFSAIGDGNTTYYAIADANTGEWEVGVGTYSTSGNTLSRDTVLDSSNTGSLVVFATGAKDVICTQPAERAVYLEAAGTSTIVPGITISGLTASTALALDASKNVVSVANTGTGSNVLNTSPTLVTPALGTPSSGVVTNLTGTASININGTVGASTPSTGAFTLLSASGTSTLAAVTAVGRVEISGGSGDRIFQVSGTSATTGTTQFGEVFNPTFGAAVTTLYGRYIGFTSNGATGTNAYAMYVEPLSGTSTFTNRWGLYLAGTDKNHLNGPVTMGTGLAVTGAISATTGMAVGGATAGAGGIAFPATQVASADANTLDDYEEGTWTPSVGGTATYTIQLGRYTKIGNIVHLEFMLTSNGGAGASNAITGLPFSAGTTMRWAASIANVHGVQFNGTSPMGEAYNSSLLFYGFSNNATSGTADFTTFTNANILNGSCSYRVA